MTTSYRVSEFGRIGISEDKWYAKQTPLELPEHKKGYHPTKCLHKKFTSFYEGYCHVRFDRKTIPKSGKSIIKDCFVEHKDGYFRIWDRETRALLTVCNDIVNIDVLQNNFKRIRDEHRIK